MQNADGRPPAVAGPAYRHAHDEVRIRPGIEPETRCSGPGRAAARGRRRRSTDRGRIGCRQSAGADQLLDELVAGDVLVGTALDRLGRVGRSLIALVDDLTSRPRDSDKKAGARPARRRTRGAGRAALARRLDLQGVIPEHADQAVRYLAKYLTKAIGETHSTARTWPSSGTSTGSTPSCGGCPAASPPSAWPSMCLDYGRRRRSRPDVGSEGPMGRRVSTRVWTAGTGV